MIDIDKETILNFSAAARECPGKPHCATIIRWAQQGVRNVRLETIVVGGRRFTSREAVRRFIAKLNAGNGDTETAPAIPRTPNERQRAIEQAKAELAAEGI